VGGAIEGAVSIPLEGDKMEHDSSSGDSLLRSHFLSLLEKVTEHLWGLCVTRSRGAKWRLVLTQALSLPSQRRGLH
jgi:hypothetical protein